MFPAAFVEAACGEAVARFAYEAAAAEDLALHEGDTVVLLKAMADWYYGRVDDRWGIFPAAFVEVTIPLP